MYSCLHVATVLNPSFEYPVVTSDVSGCPSYWPVGSGAVLIRSGSNGYGGILAADGNQLLVLPNGATIQQFIAFSPGALYTLSFYAACGSSGSASIGVYIGDRGVLTISAAPTMAMTYYSVSFVADVSSQTLSFGSNCGSYCRNVAFIDLVSVTQGRFYYVLYVWFMSCYINCHLCRCTQYPLHRPRERHPHCLHLLQSSLSHRRWPTTVSTL